MSFGAPVGQWRELAFSVSVGVIGGAGEGQAREERGRRELGGGHLAGAFGRVRKAEVRPDEEARWQGQAVCPEA